jgi:uncharacterized protein YifN (PemK superfamily)
MWGNRKKPDEGTEDLTVRFRPGGGFNKTGSFTEGNIDREYERQGFINLEVGCDRLKYIRSWSLENSYDEEDTLVELGRERLAGSGRILPSHYGTYSLSFLGGSRNHRILDVNIHKSAEKMIYVVPMRSTHDLDISEDETFSLDVRLDGKTFDELHETLRANPSFSTIIFVRLDQMRGMYTTWSPSVSDGRVLKFLDRRADIENEAEAPEEFRDVGFGGYRLPFSITVQDLSVMEDPVDE